MTHSEAMRRVREYPKKQADERRERIATACLQGLLAGDDWLDGRWFNSETTAAKRAVALADALIAELDGWK